MKILILILISTIALIAKDRLEIKAQHISYENKKQKIILRNNVIIKYGINILKTQKAIIRLKNNTLISYKVQDKVLFFYQDKDKTYNIKADNIFFDAIKNTYTIEGNITLEDNASNIIKADKAIINKNMDTFSIEGSQQPVSLEFKLNE